MFILLEIFTSTFQLNDSIESAVPDAKNGMSEVTRAQIAGFFLEMVVNLVRLVSEQREMAGVSSERTLGPSGVLEFHLGEIFYIPSNSEILKFLSLHFRNVCRRKDFSPEVVTFPELQPQV